jgi:hypothetical protein
MSVATSQFLTVCMGEDPSAVRCSYTPVHSACAVTYWYPQLTTMLLLLQVLLVGLQLPGRVLSEPVLFRHVHPLAGGQQDLEAEGWGEEAESRDVVQQSVARDVVLQSVAVPQTAVAADEAVVGVPGGWHGRYHRFHFVRIHVCDTPEKFFQIFAKIMLVLNQCWGSGSGSAGFACFWASWIRIH